MENYLFVCSGNTCRSPMAEAYCKSLGLVASSAGIMATDGKDMNPYAKAVLKKAEIDIPKHSARQLTKEIVDKATTILVMDSSHLWAVNDEFPKAKNKTFMLKQDGEINDPFGTNQAIYDETFRTIKTCLDAGLKKGFKLPKENKTNKRKIFCPNCGKAVAATGNAVDPTYEELLCDRCYMVLAAEKIF